MGAWRTLATEDPALAQFARKRLQYAVAYLATIRADGGPRLHPVSPIVNRDGLFVFMEPDSPKRADLLRDPRYALHAGVEDDDGGSGELSVRGSAVPVTDPTIRPAVMTGSTRDRWVLFSLGVDQLVARISSDSGSPNVLRWPGAV